MALWPGVALALAVYGINMFGDALRDLWDPRLRGGLGRYGKVKIKKR
jgi:peptide/nickel transport system permease protein